MSRKLFALAAILALVLATAFEAGAGGACTAGNPNANVLEATPTSAFTDNLDGTVTHALTGLMWKRCAQGQAWNGATCTGTATPATWSGALAAAVAETTGGHNDWRLPNKNELGSLAESCGYSPAINQTLFPATPVSNFWSSSSVVPNPTYAWIVCINDGGLYAGAKEAGNLYVRLVRGGQSFGSFDAQATYTVTYNGNSNSGGSAPVDGGSPYISGSTVTVLGNSGSLVKTDYTFSGWNTQANGSGTGYAAGATFNIGADTTLYAQWTPTVEVTQTFDLRNDFSINNGNPNGVWSYGRMPTNFSQFDLYTLTETRAEGRFWLGTSHMWMNDSSPAYGVPTGWLSSILGLDTNQLLSDGQRHMRVASILSAGFFPVIAELCRSVCA